MSPGARGLPTIRLLGNWLRGALTLILAVVTLPLVAGPARPGHANAASIYITASWNTADGLPSGKIHDVLQSRNGYLWIATRNGLARFDGVRFEVFNTTNTPELRSDLINSLFEDRAGTLWIGSETGKVTCLTGSIFKPVAMPADWPLQPILRIISSTDGIVWILSHGNYLCGLRDNRIVANIQPNDQRLQDVVIDRDGAAWVAGGSLIGRLDGTALRSDESCPPPDLFHPRIVASPRGGIWVAEGGRLRRWQDGHWVESRTEAKIGTAVRALMETSQGAVLIGTFDRGLQVVSTEGTLTQIDRDKGLPENWIQTIAEDAEGNLWLGVGSKGLWRLRPRRVAMVGAPDQWRDCSILCVTPRNAGGIWVGTEGAGLYRVSDDEQVEHVGGDSRDRSAVVRTLSEDRNGVLWVGLSGKNLSTFKDLKFSPAFKNAKLVQTFALAQTRDDTLWIGTHDGFATARHAAPNDDTVALQDIEASVRGIAETSDGAVWLGTLGRGILQIRNGKRRFFDHAVGLPENFIWTITADSEDTIWAGTLGHGLVRIRDEKILTLTERNGLPGGLTTHIQDDGAGHLWIASTRGIYRLLKAEIDEVADGRRTLLSCMVLDTNDGLASTELTGGSQPTGCRTPDGRLWFATAGGLAVIDPNHIETNSRPPSVLIEQVRTEGRAPATFTTTNPHDAAAALLSIAPGANRVEIDYTALSFTAPDRVRFRFRLEGRDADWTDAGIRRTAYYSYLPPGPYRFQVIACNSDGLWNDTGATLAFELRPYFWQTSWFAVLAAMLSILAAVGLALGVARHRYRRRFEEWRRIDAISAERTRIARDIHDDLGAGLTQVSLLAHSAQRLLPDPTRTAERLDEIQTAVHDMTQSMDEIVWAVNPRCDSIDSLVSYLGQFAQNYLRAGGVRCELDLPLDLPPQEVSAEARHSLYLVLRETLNNVLKHARAKTVTLTMELTDTSITLIVTDDGIGLDNQAGSEGADCGGRTRAGLGLAGMRQRLQEAGGHFQVGRGSTGGAAMRLNIPFLTMK